ncbi:bifunctional diguanylate cyclase/phosphodiesterase [Blastococcus sp. TF02A-35]|uniref:putative bifunctional diguanylate cyclase/phosphodiesterase n=1 Tax=Blastococcus sp. TF02A-35 TaxID=2559612 RepID=UPI001072ED78|nr:bifunctional diguanylate cyclase/phosphodiesterase [Blastococcus sp. TF02A_35]TFV53829.1 bifunctional diguanylate cyclase/phosphodiesterase [Blastococcus sp. TF02A_35]
MSRLVSSWRFLAVGLVLAVLAVAGFALNLQQRERERAFDHAITDAGVVSELLVEVELSSGDGVVSTLSTAVLTRIDRGVAHLRDGGRLVGLQLWTRDGRLLYSDSVRPDPLSPSEQALLADVLAGRPRVEFEQDESRSAPTATVLIAPDRPDGQPAGLVAEILLPEDAVATQLREATVRLLLTVGVLLLGLVVVATTSRRRMLRREHRASHDTLTGLGNRSLLLQEDLSGGPRGLPDHAALLLLDLEGFKEVNDGLGHVVGDHLLIAVADVLRAAVRSDDVVTRLGDDEFAVLLRDVPDADAAQERARAIGARLERPFTVDGVTLEIGVSVGLALHPEHGEDAAALLRRADMALHRAKLEGGGIRLFDPADDRNDGAQLQLLAELRGAIDNGDLRLHFQPKVALRTGRTMGFEALVRWQHPERGLLGPGAFVPAAERTALMRPLTQWVLREAVRRCAGWRAEGWEVDVAVNVAPATLLDPEFPARVNELLAAEQLPGHALELEMTETAAMVDPRRTAETLRRLQAMGVRVSIDDFGAGYTSLSYLKTLPVSALKIDRGFVTHLLEEGADEAVTRTVVQLAHDLGLTVVAEGVETAEVRQRLLELGCDEAQGYFIARPMEPDAVPGWLREAAAAARPADARPALPAPRRAAPSPRSAGR